ncbi:flagellin [Clostridium sp. SYSU_GA19001]|uniref:flagellin N-terminal helical domain-containing protein n=1 Tax=Clostridium caldaquaticum TaxID=2940653 RepID=UPI002076D700|nr:flagellin [Clostridium caldaquaticum]MCM8710963.1 flagellin [Clostridium caldaquaticum]
MIINHNLNALNAHRNMTGNTAAAGKSMEKLSSGLRINKAGDDAAGLAISEKMRGQIRGLDQAARNAQDGISMIQTAEGALNETHSILQRMRELAVQASNDTSTLDDRREIQKEMNQLTDEIDRIGNNTQFNTKNLIDGTNASTALKVHIGANAGQNMDVTIADMRSSAIGSTAGSGQTSSASIATDFSGALDSVLHLADAQTPQNQMDITLDQDYENAGAVVDAINNQIQGNAIFKDKIEAKLLDGNKITLVNKTSEQITTSNGGGTVDVADSLKITVGAINNSLTSVNSLKVTSPETASTGGVLTQGGANSAITVIDDAIKMVSAERSKLGAYANRLEHTINNLGTSSENLTAAESRIRDVDMAKEMMAFSKNNILSQAAQAMISQANQQPQGVLQLLR